MNVTTTRIRFEFSQRSGIGGFDVLVIFKDKLNMFEKLRSFTTLYIYWLGTPHFRLKTVVGFSVRKICMNLFFSLSLTCFQTCVDVDKVNHACTIL